MTGVYKLIFDLALYYTLSGFYIRALLQQEVSALGMVLLCLTVVAYMLLHRRCMYKRWYYLALLLPVVSFLAHSGWYSAIHLLISWVYIAYCLITEKTDTDLKRFQEKFKQGCVLWFAILPGLLLSKQGSEAFVSVIGYLLVQMISGICCLRTLREGKADHGRQGLIVLSITAACAMLTLLGVPQLLMLGLNSVWSILIKGLSLLAYVLAYGIIWLLEQFVSWGQDQTAGKTPQKGMSTAEMLGIDESLLTSGSGEILWVEIFGYIFLALLIVVCVILLLRFLIGYRNTNREIQDFVWSEETDRLVLGRHKRSWRKPQEPRKAIRYYYSLFLHECRRKGIPVRSSYTNCELASMSADVFAESSQLLGNLYSPARYCLSQPVTSQQVKQAAKLWQGMKRMRHSK